MFGKRVLITGRDDWPIAEVVAAYRSQSEAEFAFRQLKDPHLVSFSPMHHWTDHNIRVHVFTCVLALQIAHLMRRHAAQAGLTLSVRELLDQLAGIQETVLIYPSTGGRPKARHMLTETTPAQDQLVEFFDLNRWAPRTSVIHPKRSRPALTSKNWLKIKVARKLGLVLPGEGDRPVSGHGGRAVGDPGHGAVVGAAAGRAVDLLRRHRRRVRQHARLRMVSAAWVLCSGGRSASAAR